MPVWPFRRKRKARAMTEDTGFTPAPPDDAAPEEKAPEQETAPPATINPAVVAIQMLKDRNAELEKLFRTTNSDLEAEVTALRQWKAEVLGALGLDG